MDYEDRLIRFFIQHDRKRLLSVTPDHNHSELMRGYRIMFYNDSYGFTAHRMFTSSEIMYVCKDNETYGMLTHDTSRLPSSEVMGILYGFPSSAVDYHTHANLQGTAMTRPISVDYHGLLFVTGESIIGITKHELEDMYHLPTDDRMFSRFLINEDES